MKILLTTDTVGGVWDYSLELAAGLGRRGVTTLLATMGRPLSPEQRLESAAVPGMSVHESSFRLEWMQDPWEEVERAGRWLLELEQEARPDLIHLNGYAHGALAWRAPVLMVAHSCVSSWWQAVHGEPAPAEWDRYRREVTQGLRGARLVVAPTASMLRCIERHYGKPAAGAVVPNGREPSHYRPLPKEPFILAAGRLWDQAKNIATLSEVAADLPWPVYVAGEAQHPDGGRPEHPQVQPLGRLDRPVLAEWFGRASIYALPARYEPFGLSVLEAALAGCALVLGDIPTLREVWGDTALFVAPDDPAALRGAVQRLIDSPEERMDLARRARSRAFRYTPERMVAGYLAHYRALVRDNATPAERFEAEFGEREEVERLECVS